jgi:hypothetical protein
MQVCILKISRQPISNKLVSSATSYAFGIEINCGYTTVAVSFLPIHI